MTGRAYIRRRSVDINLAEIHEEISELLDKQVNVQKQSLKNFRGSRSSCKLIKKCVMKMKEKNDCHVKIFAVKGRSL